MYFYIIKYVYSFHHTHISVCHFVGVFVYAGTINRPLRLLTDCQNVADGLPFCGYIHICGRDKSAPTAANGLPFCGCFRICGHDKSAPTAADGLPKHC